MPHRLATGFVCLLLIGICSTTTVGKSPQEMVFTQIGDTPLKLDFYAAKTDKPAPLVVWIHGGAWRQGHRSSCPIKPLVEHGFAVASLDYRLSPEARFPAQMHDIKSGIRFLRSNASRLNIAADKIVIAGASAGGHLAALAGVSTGVDELEDVSLGNANVSSHVAAIVSLYGASNLESILSQSTPHGLNVREPALKLLLGDLPDKSTDLAKLASPVTHVDLKDPPLLLVHGDQDPQMPINQSHELHGKYEALGLKVKFEVLHGAAHGGKEFYTEGQLKSIADWLNGVLRS